MSFDCKRTVRLFSLLTASALALSCGGMDESGEESADQVYEPLVAGSNAAFVSTTMPTLLAPGERRFVQVTMTNTGAADPANTWTPAGGYALHRLDSFWGWSYRVVGTSVPVNTNAVFGLIIRAPGAGTYSFKARMRVLGDLYFGDTVNVPNIVVSNAATPMWRCTYVPGSSTVPTTMTPGEIRSIAVTVQNTGTGTWPASGVALRSQDAPASLWGNILTNLTTAVAPSATHTFNFNIKAPAAAGTYALKRQIYDGGAQGVGFFNPFASCLNTNITVTGAATLNSSLVSHTLPAAMAPGETRVVSVTMNNTGTEAWQGDGNYVLYSKNTPTSLWSETLDEVNIMTSPASNHTLQFVITAPVTPGNYNHVWQMRKLSGTNANFFGAIVNVPVTVDGGNTAEYNASVVAQDIPLRVTAGEPAVFSITMMNNGAQPWTGSTFSLFSTNTPAALWGATSRTLGAAETVAAGAQRVFNLNVTAPTTPGTYDSSWRMRWAPNGIGFFGQTALTSGIEVTLCGNGTIDAGETCDDDNLVNGDDCNDQCQSEVSETIDLASQAADRTIIGSQTNKQMANVAIGDVTGDGTADVVVSENINLTLPARNQAGGVYGFSGGAGFFTGGSTTGSAGSTFQIYGAQPGDGLGAHGLGGVVIGDVTGDGVADLIVSAPGEDGVDDLRLNAGAAYLFAGGAGLTGAIDLATMPAPAALTATFLGAAASHSLVVLGTGEVTGDTIADLILGAPGGQRVYVVPGGAGLTGTIDLSAPTVTVYTITGTGLGNMASTGDFGGGAGGDLILGFSNFTSSAGSESGGAWGFFGPIAANDSTAGADVTWIGAGANVHLGGVVRVGNVLGTADADVVITANQQRKAGVQVGAANVFAGPIAAGTYDLSSSSPQSAIILGRDFGDTLGNSMQLGDWNLDGVLDIAVASSAADGPTNTRTNSGELFIVRGGATLTGTIDLSVATPSLLVYGAIQSDALGSRANNLAFRDIDADGAADVCVGSQRGGGGTFPGRVDCFSAP